MAITHRIAELLVFFVVRNYKKMRWSACEDYCEWIGEFLKKDNSLIINFFYWKLNLGSPQTSPTISSLVVNEYDTYNFEKLDIVSICGTIIDMNTKNKKVLKSIFDSPVSSSITWKDIELLLVSLGAEISEGNGSRVRIVLNGIRAVFHRPHPQKETDKGAIISIRRFLKEAGVKSC